MASGNPVIGVSAMNTFREVSEHSRTHIALYRFVLEVLFKRPDVSDAYFDVQEIVPVTPLQSKHTTKYSGYLYYKISLGLRVNNSVTNGCVMARLLVTSEMGQSTKIHVNGYAFCQASEIVSMNLAQLAYIPV